MQAPILSRCVILATLFGLTATLGQPLEQPQAKASTAGTLQVSAPCGTAAGARFNLEPRLDPLPQNGTTVDFLPGAGLGGGDLIVGAANDMRLLTSGSGVATDFRGIFGLTSQTGYYVHRSGTDPNPCAADFEGGLAAVPHPTSGNLLVGVGYPTVAAYPPGQSFYLADTRIGVGEASDSAIGVFRTTAANLNNPSLCPDGTLSESQSKQCWPTRVLVALGTTFESLNSSPNLTIDERALGTATGAGDVYISGTQKGMGHSSIFIAACKNDLSACSPAVTVSGLDAADFSNLAVRPDGGVTATYTVATGGLSPTPTGADIKYVSCQPHGAPAAVSCLPATLIVSETMAIPLSVFDSQGPLMSNKFVLDTFPKHAHRVDANGIETYVIWDRCKVSTAIPYPGLTFVGRCPDADIIMAASNNNGQSWSFAAVDTSDEDQYQPWVVTDRATNIIHIGYYTAVDDSNFQHRAQVVLRRILPGNATPDLPTAAEMVTTVPLEPNGDPVMQGIFIGHYLGVAARTSGGGTRVYVHYTHTSVPGIYNGVSDPEQNNHLSRIDF